MSKNNSGNNNPMFGKSGIYKRSEEAKRKMSISKIGKKRTKESRYKQSKSVSGKNNHQAKQIIIDGIKYDTMKEASKRLNISMYKLRKL
jgi:TPP-dependent indolepyruvate ferredoxin oxidoreductase alpha subunit